MVSRGEMGMVALGTRQQVAQLGARVIQDNEGDEPFHTTQISIYDIDSQGTAHVRWGNHSLLLSSARPFQKLPGHITIQGKSGLNGIMLWALNVLLRDPGGNLVGEAESEEEAEYIALMSNDASMLASLVVHEASTNVVLSSWTTKDPEKGDVGRGLIGDADTVKVSISRVQELMYDRQATNQAIWSGHLITEDLMYSLRDVGEQAAAKEDDSDDEADSSSGDEVQEMQPSKANRKAAGTAEEEKTPKKGAKGQSKEVLASPKKGKKKAAAPEKPSQEATPVKEKASRANSRLGAGLRAPAKPK
jgi:hypothetical protein